MDIKTAVTVFAVVFVAELGDKTQLATLLFAAEKEADKLLIFASASLALIVSAAIAVLVGAALAEYVNPSVLRYVAAGGFICIGVWTLLKG